LTGVRSVRAGGVHTLWLGDDGMVWAAGHNTNGQLGDGSNTSRANPVRVETAAGVALDNVVAIAASATHSLALRSDGSVLGWGTGNFGQIGTGASGATLRPIAVRDAQGAALANVTAIAAGDGTSFFLLANGTVLAAGDNAGGRLGIGSSGGGGAASLVRDAGGNVFGNVVALSSHFQHTLLLRADGSVWGFGRNGSLNLADGTSVSRNGPVRVQGLAP
jgi:alpha-tubulin suppressor-like RCC1 family protein